MSEEQSRTAGLAVTQVVFPEAGYGMMQQNAKYHDQFRWLIRCDGSKTVVCADSSSPSLAPVAGGTQSWSSLEDASLMLAANVNALKQNCTEGIPNKWVNWAHDGFFSLIRHMF